MTAFVPPLNPALAGVSSSPVRDLLALLAKPEIISFAGGIPDPAFFDVDGLKTAFDSVLTSMPERALQYSASEGEVPLREVAAERLSATGLVATVDDVLITTGSQEGISLVGQTLLGPGSVVLVERPTYLAALQALSMTGATFVGVDADEEGMIPGRLAAAIDEHRASMVYLVPTFQNPTGRTMSASRRREIADVLIARPVVLVEDDPYSELRFAGTPSPPISADPRLADRAILLTTLSKVVAPGLRVGWLKAPQAIMRPLIIAKQATDLHSSTVDQLAAAWYLRHTDLQAHLDPVRTAYRERRDAMIDALAPVLPDGSSLTRPDGGMFIWVELPPAWDTRQLLTRAIEHHVAFVPGDAFYCDGSGTSTMRLSYCTSRPERIREGVARLGRALARPLQ